MASDLTIYLDDRPGELARLGYAGVNISLAYLATSTRLVFGADNLAEVKAALD
ncbi:MAG TPA: hypothetical protein VMQ81_01650 [Acidimicrobiia bacterium]|nr:hypothetical protein [Acidimicrobiia bacterium]